MSRPRKSSIDVTRKPLKAHRPFRGDDYTHGKKTGLNVREVDRRSDGFESFGEVLGQADGFTPPDFRKTLRGRRTPSPEEGEEEYDEYGTMSMELEEAIELHRRSPVSYLSAAPRPSVPSSVNRTSSTIRPGDRSYIDYDQIPSPRASTSRIYSNGSFLNTSTPRRQSTLSHSIVPSSLDGENDREIDESDNEPFDDYPADNMDDGGGFDYDQPPGTGSSSPTAAKVSFTEMDQDDEGLTAIENPPISSPPRNRKRDKGKQKEITPVEEDIVMEDDIAQGLAEVENTVQLEDEPFEESYQIQKRGREEDAPPPKEKKKSVKRKKVHIEAPLSETHNIVDGVRRGTRTRYKPLEWWRCEKVVYGRRDSGTSMVPVIKDIIRLPKDEAETLASKKKRASSRARSRSRAVEGPEEQDVIVFNPEEGWDDATEAAGVVMDYFSKDEVSRRLACTAKMVNPRPTVSNDFLYHKIFAESDFMAGGQVILPVGGKKPSKSSNDNSYMFYIIEGAINLRVHRTSLVLASGAMFLVPRGNNYYMENISQRPTKMFFAQARRVLREEEVPPEIRPATNGNGGGNESIIRRSRSLENSAMKKEPPSKKGSAPRSTSVAVDKKASKKVAIDRAKSR